MARQDGPSAIADTLSTRGLGRAALQAAARRDLRFDFSEFEPLATPAFCNRLFELAKQCHAHVGWRARKWFWPVAALTAPLTVAVLDAVGATSALAGWTSVAAAAGGVDPSVAQNQAAQGGVWAARALGFAIWWLLALGVFAVIYRASVRRTLGVSRAVSYADAARSGPMPLLGLAAGVGLTALLVTAPAPDQGLLARADDVAAGVAARAEAREEAKRDEARLREEAARAAEQWRVIPGENGEQIATIVAQGEVAGEMTLSCENGVRRMRYATGAALERQGEGRLSIGLSTNRQSLGITTATIVEGVLEWQVTRNAVQALRFGTWVRLEILDGEVRWPVQQFTLTGSTAAIDVAMATCK